MRVTTALAILVLLHGCCTPLQKLVNPRLEVPAAAEPLAWTPPHPATAVSQATVTWHDAARNRDVPVRLYVPDAPAGPLPVVVFSHGIGESRDSYVWLGEALARAGWMSVHLTHAGTDRAVLDRGYWHLYEATKNPENWRARPLDASLAIDRLLDDASLPPIARGRVDASRIVVAGHSAGAFTALAVAGMQLGNGQSFRDARVKAVVAMSMPRMPGVVAPNGYDPIGVPVLHLTGTCDASLIYRTRPRDRRVPFEQGQSSPQILVTVEGVNHDVFSDPDREANRATHAELAKITLAFLEGYVRNDAAARAWLAGGGLTREASGTVAVERK